MCILFFALNQHPQYPVIICANRDEFHQRPTQAMHYWHTPDILAGKDLQAGGTWLGLTKAGRFSALTNFRAPLRPKSSDNSANITDKKSRGQLVLSALENSDKQVKTLLEQASEQFNGFNLVYGQLNKLYYFDSVNKHFSEISSGIHSLCNGALNDIWPKMALGQQALVKLINSEQALNIDALFDLMKNAQQAETALLPNTGVGEQWEKFLSAIFIVSPEYGTRTTTIITQDTQGIIKVADKSYNSEGKVSLEQNFTLGNNLLIPK